MIRRWAEARGAQPATVPGTERGGRPGVLRFQLPGSDGEGLPEIGWDERFRTFDERRLVFLFPGRLKSGEQRDFFRLDAPGREAG